MTEDHWRPSIPLGSSFTWRVVVGISRGH